MGNKKERTKPQNTGAEEAAQPEDQEKPKTSKMFSVKFLKVHATTREQFTPGQTCIMSEDTAQHFKDREVVEIISEIQPMKKEPKETK
jgi:hypothetical protein